MKSSKLVALTLFLAAIALVIGSQVYSVNLSAQVKVEDCTNKVDDDGDGLVDGDDPDCKPTGTGCSPGFYKNNQEIWVGICCTTESDPSCAELLSALTCRGSDASCGRSAAAAFLDACTGCSE